MSASSCGIALGGGAAISASGRWSLLLIAASTIASFHRFWWSLAPPNPPGVPSEPGNSKHWSRFKISAKKIVEPNLLTCSSIFLLSFMRSLRSAWIWSLAMTNVARPDVMMIPLKKQDQIGKKLKIFSVKNSSEELSLFFLSPG